MKSYLLSALKRQFAASKETFLARNPNDWLVWEPGSWKAPRTSTLVLDTPALSKPSSPGKAAEALAIGLPEIARVRIGRLPDVEISLNDGTLSGTHFALIKDGGRWSAEDLGSTNGTSIETVRLKPHERMGLRNGSSIRAGSVMLTFHTAEGLWARLSE